MSFDPKDIEQIAKLARIKLTQEEKDRFSKDLSNVFDYIELLNEVDTTNVEETSQVTGLEDVFRPDKVKDCDEKTRKKLVSMFSCSKKGQLCVPSVFQ